MKRLAELTSQCAPNSESVTLVFRESQKSAESLFLSNSWSTPKLPSAQPPTPKRLVKQPRGECTHNLVLFQNFLKEMEEIRRFYKIDWATVWKAWNDTPKHFWEKK